MNNKQSCVVLEELMHMAMDEAIDLRDKPNITPKEQGELMAYFKILDTGKQQADVFGVKFQDNELAAFDPYSLLVSAKKAA